MNKIIGIIVVAVFLFGGCGSAKDELAAESSAQIITDLESQIDDLEAASVMTLPPATTIVSTTTRRPVTTTTESVFDDSVMELIFVITYEEQYGSADGNNWDQGYTGYIMSAGDRVCREVNGNGFTAANALETADDFYYFDPFFDKIYNIEEAYWIMGALGSLGGCEDEMTRLQNTW